MFVLLQTAVPTTHAAHPHDVHGMPHNPRGTRQIAKSGDIKVAVSEAVENARLVLMRLHLRMSRGTHAVIGQDTIAARVRAALLPSVLQHVDLAIRAHL